MHLESYTGSQHILREIEPCPVTSTTIKQIASSFCSIPTLFRVRDIATKRVAPLQEKFGTEAHQRYNSDIIRPFKRQHKKTAAYSPMFTKPKKMPTGHFAVRLEKKTFMPTTWGISLLPIRFLRPWPHNAVAYPSNLYGIEKKQARARGEMARGLWKPALFVTFIPTALTSINTHKR